MHENVTNHFSSLEMKTNYSCNSNCSFCSFYNRKNQGAMSFNDIAENLRYFKKYYRIREVCVSGGEPSIRSDFIEILKLIRMHSLHVYLHTNAITFHDKDFAKECSCWINRALVSFHFHNADSCDRLTGTIGSFEKRISGISNMLAYSFPVRTNTLILKSNYEMLPDIGKAICGLGVRESLLTFPFFFELSPDQIHNHSPGDIKRIKPYLQKMIGILLQHDIRVSIQGLPPCMLEEFEHYREIDCERALIDSQFQFDKYSLLFSKMLGFSKKSERRSCKYDHTCWGFARAYSRI